MDLIIWGSWQGKLNDDSNRSLGLQTFSKFKTGSSFILVILSVALNIFAVLFQRFRPKDKQRKTRLSDKPATTSDTEVSDAATSNDETNA